MRPARTLSLEVRGPFAAALRGPAEENLALRAARALAAAAGETRGAAIALEKNLPVAAGLGGGSADAAAALRALSRLWRTRLSAAELGELAAALGTDVPACLAGGAWRVSGAGEVLDRPARGFGPVPVVLVNPGVAAPTAEVFARLRPPIRLPPPPPRLAGGAAALARALARTRNDLEAPALALAPAIAHALAALRAAPGRLLARMSGSGATCFGLFRTPGDAARAARALRRSGRGWWVRAALLGAAAPLRRPPPPA